MRDTALMIFAKTPLAGFAKTRLIPVLGDQGAAQLAEQLLFHAVNQAEQADIGDIFIYIAPDMQHPFWQQSPFQKYHLENQCAGDLGQRMSAAFSSCLSRYRKVLIMGTDCPFLDAQQIRLAAHALNDHDACITPVADGGYAMLGLRESHPLLFSDIPWSTHDVFEITLARLNRLGWHTAIQPELIDIDDANDLRFLPDSFKL